MRAHKPYVIGYHGCGRDLGLKLASGELKIKAEPRKYHWLGSGIYFWENDRKRGLEWAQEKAARGELIDPFVIGAVIELRHCLDLSVRENVPLIAAAHESLKALHDAAGKSLPQNRVAPKDQSKDKVMRFLDCAVINHLVEQAPEPFDTVRGLFVEGEPIYSGGEIFHKTHVEIAVRNPACIHGLFVPLDHEGLPHEAPAN